MKRSIKKVRKKQYLLYSNQTQRLDTSLNEINAP
jgi:hypothetical protein